MALDWNSLWLNDDQRGYDAFQKEKSAEAASLFDDPQWKAAAHYRAGNFAEADQLLQQSDSVTDMYNRANALARQGRFDDAIALYDAVLEAQPEHEDATYNRDLIKQQQQQQQEQQSSSEQDNQQQSEEQQQSRQEQQEQQQSDQSENEQQQDQTSQQDNEQQDSEDEQQASEQQQSQEQDSEQQDEDEQQASRELDQQLDEQEQASEQWLRRIPDDPAGLLRRKFKYQYQQSERQNNTSKYW